MCYNLKQTGREQQLQQQNGKTVVIHEGTKLSSKFSSVLWIISFFHQGTQPCFWGFSAGTVLFFFFFMAYAQGFSSCKCTVSCNAQDSGHHRSEANNLLFDRRTQMSFPLIFINIFNCCKGFWEHLGCYLLPWWLLREVTFPVPVQVQFPFHQ